MKKNLKKIKEDLGFKDNNKNDLDFTDYINKNENKNPIDKTIYNKIFNLINNIDDLNNRIYFDKEKKRDGK